METIREFASIDRYYFDFKKCTTGKGWAQVDTEQDASYFGTWANPFNLKVITYAEGDITIRTAEHELEFAKEIREIKEWNIENGWKFHGIDPGFNEKLADKFKEIGLADYLH